MHRRLTEHRSASAEWSSTERVDVLGRQARVVGEFEEPGGPGPARRRGGDGSLCCDEECAGLVGARWGR